MNILYCNQTYARAVDEVTPSAAVSAAKEIAPGPGGWGRGLAAEALASGAPVTRSRHLVVGGQRRLFEITEFPIGGGDGAWRIAGIAIDRGDTDEARAELARHMAAHGEVLEKLGTGIVIFGSDTRVMFSNAAFAAIWGFDRDWLLGAPTHGELLEDLLARRMYPEQNDFQDFKRQRQELFTSLLDSHEELLHLPDERVMRVVISPHPQGGLMFTTEDVTDRLTLERSYNTLIAVQTETLDNLHEGVAVYGADARLKLYNPAFARIWWLAPDLLDGEPRMVDVVDAARDLMLFEGDWGPFRIRLIANSSERTSRGGRFERADGSILDYAAVPLPDGAMLFTYIDVTDSVAVQRALRERNEALLEADRLKSEFITNVSYELRTPLNTIIGFTEILSNQYFGTLNRRQSEYTRGVLEASQQLLALIDDILDLALIESGQLELELAQTDARVMLDSVVSLSRERARKRELALELKCADDLGTLVMDERRVKQALFNLVSNAIKYTPPSGQITIAAARGDDTLTITVSDTGAGIASADRERVFEKFERGADGDLHGGVGLGLALVKSFIDLHGGAVELNSTLGQGTSVRIILPLAQGTVPLGLQTS
jgi:signal transduction histidine kinase